MENPENHNIIWWENKKVIVGFSMVPKVGVRYYVPSMSEKERRSIERYPFINKKELNVTLFDKKKSKVYKFPIFRGYCFDGASIPKAFWRVIGPNTDNRFLIPALVHDVLCENHDYVDYDREFSSEVFNALLEAAKVNPFKRYLMKHSVNSFQRFCHWEKKK